jgi:hypothetical protein
MNSFVRTSSVQVEVNTVYSEFGSVCQDRYDIDPPSKFASRLELTVQFFSFGFIRKTKLMASSCPRGAYNPQYFGQTAQFS